MKGKPPPPRNRRRLVYYIVQSILRVGFWVVFGIKIKRVDRVPVSGRILLAPNHRSYLDPPLSALGLSREVFFLAKVELFKNPIVAAIFRLLNAKSVRRSGVDTGAIRTIEDLLQRGEAVVIFPEGGRCLTTDFLPAQRGIAMVALKTGTDIIPTYIRGSRPWWKALYRRGWMTVNYGSVIRYEEARNHGDNREQMRWMLSEIEKSWREMAANNN
jgi:1-acyl-sn-glycerol-3-phosphate acyltransferase